MKKGDILSQGITEKEVRFFHNRALFGHVVDKDEIADALVETRSHYRTLGIPHRRREKILAEQEARVFGGTATEQVASSGKLFEALDGLRGATILFRKANARVI